MQFEDGNQKGEHYLCLNCDINYIQNNDISHCYQLPIATLSCTQKSYRWEIWQKKNSIQQELSSRFSKYPENVTKATLTLS